MQSRLAPSLALLLGSVLVSRLQGSSKSSPYTCPPLRGLSARAPYFHNGSAQTLLDAIRFYENRFGLVLTSQEESDLVAFLSSL